MACCCFSYVNLKHTHLQYEELSWRLIKADNKETGHDVDLETWKSHNLFPSSDGMFNFQFLRHNIWWKGEGSGSPGNYSVASVLAYSSLDLGNSVPVRERNYCPIEAMW